MKTMLLLQRQDNNDEGWGWAANSIGIEDIAYQFNQTLTMQMKLKSTMFLFFSPIKIYGVQLMEKLLINKQKRFRYISGLDISILLR